MKLGGSEMALDFTSSWREPAQAGGATPDRDASAEARVIEFRGYAYTRSPSRISGSLVTTYDPKTPQIWRVPLRDRVAVSISTTVPLGGYVVPPAFSADIARRLEAHGIDFSRVHDARSEINAKAFRATEVRFSAAPFEGRMRAQLTGAWREEKYVPQDGAIFVPIAQPLARLVVALFEPCAPDSFAAWGLFNACFEQKEQMEPYVAEQIAQKMMEQNPGLAAEFWSRCEQDAAFAASPVARLEFFLRRHASWDSHYNLYPVRRLEAVLESKASLGVQEARFASAAAREREEEAISPPIER
jgi:hypothetical protein